MTIKAFYRLNSFLYFFNPWQKHLARTRDTMKTFSGNFCLSKQFYFGKAKLYYIFAKSIFFWLKYETNMFLITLFGTTVHCEGLAAERCNIPDCNIKMFPGTTWIEPG